MKKPDLTKYKTTSTLYLLILIIAAVALVFGWQCTSYSLSNHSADLHIQMSRPGVLRYPKQLLFTGFPMSDGPKRLLP